MHMALQEYYLLSNGTNIVSSDQGTLFVELGCSQTFLKVIKFQNKFMKPCVVRAEILTIFCSYFGRNDDFINLF